MHDFALESIKGVGFINGLGMSGRNRAPLNFTIKKKQPKNTPCGEDPGRDLAVDVAPLNFKTILLPVR